MNDVDVYKLETMTWFMDEFGYDTSYMYGPSTTVDPTSDWAVFTMKDRLVSWQLMRLLRRHMGVLRSCLQWDESNQPILPLSGAEVSLVSAALRTMSSEVSEFARRHKQRSDHGDHVKLLLVAVWDRTVLDFMLQWEESGDRYRNSEHIIQALPVTPFDELPDLLDRLMPDEGSEYNQSDWPTQWTVEFGLAIPEFLLALERSCDMLAAVCETSVVAVETNGETANIKIAEQMRKYGLPYDSIDYTHPMFLKVTPEDAYCAAYLAAALDNIQLTLENGGPYSQQEKTMRGFFGIAELLYLALDVMVESHHGLSRLSNIINAFIGDVVLRMAMLRSGDSQPNLRGLSAEFRIRADGLHRLLSDFAGDIKINLPLEEVRLGSDGPMLLYNKMQLIHNAHDGRSWSVTADKGMLTQCVLCGRPMPDPSGLTEKGHGFRCPDALACLAIQIGAKRLLRCVICSKHIEPATDTFVFVSRTVRCNGEDCRE